MSRSLRRGGWGNPLYQHMGWLEKPDDEMEDPRYRRWKYLKVYADHWSCGPSGKTKAISNRWDRRKWNREALKEEPQLPRNHRHWGIWEWW